MYLHFFKNRANVCLGSENRKVSLRAIEVIREERAGKVMSITEYVCPAQRNSLLDVEKDEKEKKKLIMEGCVDLRKHINQSINKSIN